MLPGLLDSRLRDCVDQARECVDDASGLMSEREAFCLIRRAYGVGYVDAHREMPDGESRSVVFDAWREQASASLALAGLASRRGSE